RIIENPYDIESCKKKTSDSSYDLSVLNTSIPAQEIVEMVQNAIANDMKSQGNEKGIRILFYGLSGAGKTNLAHYIADSLGKGVITKNASDILGMFVGESEKNIAKAFDDAKKQKKILLFDEVDSFFRERSYASQSWEITQVNEFLTQMEQFDGIVICTTNLRNIMDKAMQRRFHIMVEFKSLKEEGVESLLGKYFPKLNFNEEDIRKISKYQSATPGDFGNISSRLRFMNLEKVTETYITDEICKMQEEKEYGKRSIGFNN
ncbi:ATP-binding protein, partial [Treponema sp. JC4]|uniref:ATP-binding protein n=1 Tax=Treponema sp. JC4 TaxID=1124982 RepID=UPI000587F26E